MTAVPVNINRRYCFFFAFESKVLGLRNSKKENVLMCKHSLIFGAMYDFIRNVPS